MRFVLSILAAGLLAAGCGDASGPGGSGAGGSNAGGEGVGGSGGAAANCPPEGVVTTIGPDGGELEYCGARLVIPAGALTTSTELSIQLDQDPPAAPYNRDLASPVFDIGPADLVLAAPADLTLSFPESDLRHSMAVVDEGTQTFQEFEACGVTSTSLQQFVGRLGRYAILVDPYAYPAGPDGLGDGTVSIDFMGESAVYDLDGLFGYGIFAPAADGSESVTLNSARDVPGGIQALRIDFGVDPSGVASGLTQITWTDTATSVGYTYIVDLIGSNGELTVDTASGRLSGTFTATLTGGDPMMDQVMTGTLDVSVERFSYPLELACPGGG
ncbi:MAG: hypothetical protein U0271_09660 [Polyangiaceae bacterium]